MKDSWKILAYFAGILLVGCLLAPPLYWAGQASGVKFLQETAFPRYFTRAVLLAALALLWPAVRWVRVGSWGELGLGPNPQGGRQAGAGFAFAFVLLFAMGLATVPLGLANVQGEIKWGKLVLLPLTLVVVPVMEEFLFRGALLGLVRRSAGKVWAVVFVSALFSVVHFLKPPDERGPEEVGWLGGFELLPACFHQFGEPLMVLGGFSTLFAIGVVLSLATLRTRSLWMAIGLHAGWIAGNRVFNVVFKQRDTLPPWFGERIEIGLVPLFTVVATGLLALWWLRRWGGAPPAGGVREAVAAETGAERR